MIVYVETQKPGSKCHHIYSFFLTFYCGYKCVLEFYYRAQLLNGLLLGSTHKKISDSNVTTVALSKND